MALPTNAVPLYRKLAYKSKLGFGKFGDITIQDIFAIGKEDYLVWLYYSMSNISFLDEILDRLCVEKIEKPGISEKHLKEWKHQRFRDKFEDMTHDEYMHYRYAQNCHEKRKAHAKRKEVERSVRLTKGKLQAINHGRGEKQFD